MKAYIQNISLITDIMVTASKDAHRPQLTGFSVDAAPNGSLLLIATDGTKMFVLNDPAGYVEQDEDEHPVISLPLGMMKAIGKCAGKAGEDGDMLFNLSIESRDGDTIATLCDGAMPVLKAWNVRLDCEFPNWRKIIPIVYSEEPLVQACFNLGQLADFAKLTAKSKANIRLFGNKEDSGFIVKITDRPDFFGVIMPVRDMGGAQLPPWYTGSDMPAEVEQPKWSGPDMWDDPEIKAAIARAEEMQKSDPRQTSILEDEEAAAA